MKKIPELVRIAGNLVMLLALGFLVKRFLGMGLRWTDLRSWGVMGAFLVCMTGQAFLFCIQCIPWMNFTRSLSGVKIPFRRAMPVYTRSNIYKYLTGNVFQYVGRNQLAADMHISHVDVACATILDILFCLVWMCLSAAVLLRQKAAELLVQYLNRFLIIGGIGVGIAVVAFAVFWLKFRDKLIACFRRYRKAFAPENRNALLCGIFYYLLHSSLLAAMYFVCLKLMFPADTPLSTLIMLTGAFVFAWIVGFITPGAPGGIGIRESVMMLVSGAEHEQEVLLFVLVMRAASAAADVLAFAAGAVYLKCSGGKNEE